MSVLEETAARLERIASEDPHLRAFIRESAKRKRGPALIPTVLQVPCESRPES